MTPGSQKVENELKNGTSLSIINLVSGVIEHGNDLHCSDIHIDPHDHGIKIRFRIDGVLQTMYVLPKGIYQEIISRIKILANLRTDEHQEAQDGRFRYNKDNGTYIDIRVSIVLTYFGENVVLRLLTDNNDQFTLQKLGYNPAEAEKIIKALKRPHGMILVTGPTGSGKTTTLYTFIKLLNREDISIITIEDPIEYAIAGITQIQVNHKHGLTFANGLRSILRQDPNLIMVGEIRDKETATIAVNTALTGHLLLSTLHTNDAVTTLPRLHDMGVEVYLIASTVNLIIGQRLLRRNCPKCCKVRHITDVEKQSLKNIVPVNLLSQLDEVTYGSGCTHCNQSGFCGRLSLNEILVVEDSMREAILRKESIATLKKLAVLNGMTPMLEDGIIKVKNGETTVEEVLRVINE
jgi:type IV pilus assembly protein PilB